MSKQTAVDYLVKELGDILDARFIKPMQDLLIVNAVSKAKKLEREQMIDFADNYVDNCVIPNENMAIPTIMDVPNYYALTNEKLTYDPN